MTNINTYHQMQSNLIVNGLHVEMHLSAEKFTPYRDEWEEMNAIDSIHFDTIRAFYAL